MNATSWYSKQCDVVKGLHITNFGNEARRKLDAKHRLSKFFAEVRDLQRTVHRHLRTLYVSPLRDTPYG